MILNFSISPNIGLWPHEHIIMDCRIMAHDDLRPQDRAFTNDGIIMDFTLAAYKNSII